MEGPKNDYPEERIRRNCLNKTEITVREATHFAENKEELRSWRQ